MNETTLRKPWLQGLLGKGDRRTARLTLAPMVLACLAGMGILAYSTTWGPGVGGDATVYIESARNLVDGRGLGWYGPQGNFHLLPLAPPFYPLILAGLGWIGFDLVQASRWLNVALFGATILLSGLSFHHFTRSAWLAAGLSLLVMASPIMLHIHMWAMTEPLFTFTGLVALVLLLKYFDSRRPVFWIGSASLAGLAFLTRYAGVAVACTGALACLLLVRGRWKRRWSLAGGYMLLSSLPAGLWGLYQAAVSDAVGSRQFQPFADMGSRLLAIRHPVLENVISWVPFSAVVTSWINPPFSGIFWAAMGLLSIGVLVWISRKVSQTQGSTWLDAPGVRVLALMLIFLGVYAAVIVLSYLFIYPPPHLSNRILSPLHWGGIFALFAVAFLLASLEPRWTRSVWGVVLIVWLASYAQSSRLDALEYHKSGLGYTGAFWQNSDVVAAARRIPETTPLITNELSAVLFLLHRPAYVVQEIYTQEPLGDFAAYGSQPGDEAQAVFRTRQAALLLFESIYDDFSEVYGEQTEERIRRLTDGLYLDYQGRDGRIYYYTQPGP